MSPDEPSTALSRRTLLRATATGIGAATVFGGAGAAQKTGPTPIDGSTTITDPGQYALQGDIDASTTGTCIRIRADDVVLDGGGRTIDGNGDARIGVLVAGSDDEHAEERLRNVTIRNLTVTGFTLAGIAFGSREPTVGSAGGTISRVTTTDCDVGLWLGTVLGLTVTDSTITYNTTNGVLGTESVGDTTFARTEISSNGGQGVGFATDTYRLRFARNRISQNSIGIVLGEPGTGTEVVGNLLRANGRAGIALSEETGTVVRANRLVGNGGDGIQFVASDDNRIGRNSVRHNGGAGVRLVDSDDTELIRNRLLGNGDGPLVVSGDSTGTDAAGTITG